MKLLNYAKEHYLLIIILVFASFLRLYQLNYQSLWADEISTMVNTNPDIPFGQLIDNINKKEGFPYLYFGLMKFFHFIIAYSPIVDRLFSAVLGILSVYFIYKLGKQMSNRNTGLIAALLLCVNEFSIYTSQDARPYSLILFATILSFYRLTVFIKEPTMRNTIIYGIVTGLLLNTSFFAIITLFSQVLILIMIFFLLEKDKRALFFKRLSISGLIALILFLPNYQKLLTLVGVDSGWIPAVADDSLTNILKEFLGHSEITLFAFTALFIVYLLHIFKQESRINLPDLLKNKDILNFTILISWLLIFILVMYVKSLMGASVILHRYFISLLPALLLIFAIALNSAKNRITQILSVSFLIVFILVNTNLVRKYYSLPHKTQYRELSDIIINRKDKTDNVYTNLNVWLNYFLDKDSSKNNLIQKPSLDALIDEMKSNPALIKAFWYVNADQGDYAVSNENQQFLNDKFYLESSYAGLNVWAKHFILIQDKPANGDISAFKDLKQYNGDSFVFNVESFQTSNNSVKAVGWAYFSEQNANDSKIELVLVKDGKFNFLKTSNVARPDVTSYFKSNYDLSASGFSSVIDISDLESGKYQLAIFLYNKNTNKQGLNLTDKFVEK